MDVIVKTENHGISIFDAMKFVHCDMGFLDELLKTQSTQKSNLRMVDFVRRKCKDFSPKSTYEVDNHSNLLVKGENNDGGKKPLLVCNLNADFGISETFHQTIFERKGVYHAKNGIGSNKAGIYICLNLLKLFPFANILFVNNLGHIDASFFDDVYYALCFDIPGTNSVVLNYRANDDFRDIVKPILIQFNYMEIAQSCNCFGKDIYQSHSIPTMSIASGFYNNGRTIESISIPDAANTVRFAWTIIKHS
jgi:hypothetical protein